MSIDRMAMFEAPRKALPERPMRSVKIHCAGKAGLQVVQIPRDMKAPDLIRWQGRVFLKRDEESYGEATVWPVLDADT